jgi:hypothetical protein
MMARRLAAIRTDHAGITSRLEENQANLKAEIKAKQDKVDAGHSC